MEYDENQKNGEEPQAPFRKVLCLPPALCHVCLMPRRLGKVLGEKSAVQEHFKGLSGNESVLRFEFTCFLPSTCPMCQTFLGKDKGNHYPWFTETKQELSRRSMCSG